MVTTMDLVLHLAGHKRQLKERISEEMEKDAPDYKRIAEWAEALTVDQRAEIELSNVNMPFLIQESVTVYCSPEARPGREVFTLSRGFLQDPANGQKTPETVFRHLELAWGD